MFLWCIRYIPIQDICEHVNFSATSQDNGVFSIQFCINHNRASPLTEFSKCFNARLSWKIVCWFMEAISFHCFQGWYVLIWLFILLIQEKNKWKKISSLLTTIAMAYTDRHAIMLMLVYFLVNGLSRYS